MKKLLSLVFLLILISSCQSQKIQKQKDVGTQKEYFSGTWKLVQINYQEGNATKIFPLHECMKQYELLFKKHNQNIVMTKKFATGNDCKTKSQSDDMVVNIGESSISYTEYDLKKNEQFKIYSSNKFSIMYNDIIKGKVTEIEDVYERKK